MSPLSWSSCPHSLWRPRAKRLGSSDRSSEHPSVLPALPHRLRQRHQRLISGEDSTSAIHWRAPTSGLGRGKRSYSRFAGLKRMLGGDGHGTRPTGRRSHGQVSSTDATSVTSGGCAPDRLKWLSGVKATALPRQPKTGPIRMRTGPLPNLRLSAKPWWPSTTALMVAIGPTTPGGCPRMATAAGPQWAAWVVGA